MNPEPMPSLICSVCRLPWKKHLGLVLSWVGPDEVYGEVTSEHCAQLLAAYREHITPQILAVGGITEDDVFMANAKIKLL